MGDRRVYKILHAKGMDLYQLLGIPCKIKRERTRKRKHCRTLFKQYTRQEVASSLKEI